MNHDNNIVKAASVAVAIIKYPTSVFIPAKFCNKEISLELREKNPPEETHRNTNFQKFHFYFVVKGERKPTVDNQPFKGVPMISS